LMLAPLVHGIRRTMDPRRDGSVTPEEMYEALKTRLKWWAGGGHESPVEAVTEFGRGYDVGQRALAEAVLEYARGMEEA
jgi:hypothetical protein